MMPNWIIIGAPKAGTSSLFQWLVDHPQVGGSREKETYYFVDPGTHMYRSDRNYSGNGMAGYEDIFAHCDPAARVILEATPGYMYYTTALRELPRLPSRPSVVVLLREPLAQVQSLYRYFQQNWDWIPRSMSFAEFVEAAERGTCTFKGNELASGALDNADYRRVLRLWRDACGPERLHVFLFEDMVKDPRAFMIEVASRMEIDPAFYADYDFPVENESYEAKNKVLQSLNIRVRGLIPHGRAYDLLRRLYRAANTQPVAKPRSDARPDDLAAARRLARRYLGSFDDLEREFGLDLSLWRQSLETLLEADRRPNCSDTLDAKADGSGRPDLQVP